MFFTITLEHSLARVQQREVFKFTCVSRLQVDSGRLLTRHRAFSRRLLQSRYPFWTLGLRSRFRRAPYVMLVKLSMVLRVTRQLLACRPSSLPASAWSHVPHPSNSPER